MNYRESSEAQKYLAHYTGKTVLIKISGELVNSNNFSNIAKDIAFLSEKGINIILVHGGGIQADILCNKLGIVIKKDNGRRITTKEVLDVVEMTFNKLNVELVATLKKHGIKAVGLTGIDAGIIAKKREVKDIDFGYVGDLVETDDSLIKLLLSKKYVPVIAPLTVDKKWQILNVNADTIAIELAGKVQADKVILISNVDGVYKKFGDKSTLISTLTPQEINQLIKQNCINGGMVPKLQSCISAINKGIKRVHLINGIIPHAILKEMLTKEGIGTMILNKDELEAYENELQ